MNTSRLTIKFAEKLVASVLAGEKASTWRLWDDKDLTEGQIIDLINSETNQTFAIARITKVSCKQLGHLTEEDKRGQLGFADDTQMCKVFAKYYRE